MFGSLFDTNEKQLRKFRPTVDQINSFEDSVKKLSQEQIRDKTNYWKAELKKLTDAEKENYLNEILPEAYALVRESALRV